MGFKIPITIWFPLYTMGPNTLYMAATSAIQFNPDMKSFYDRLIGEGKAHKVALAAVMRKLIILANVLVRDDRNWTVIAPEPGVG